MTTTDAYAAWRDGFRWDVPKSFNIATAILERNAPHAPALIDARAGEPVRTYSFAELDQLSNRLANLLIDDGLLPGERVGILLPQRVETLLAHLAVYKAGAVALPLFTAFGQEALRFRLKDSAARFVLADGANAPRVRDLAADFAGLDRIIDVDAPTFADALAAADGWAAHERTRADDPALIIYTSGTTGAPKGAVHGHRVLLGHLPGVTMPHAGFPQPGDRFWTPADWAWIGGLLDVLLPSLYHGVPVVAGPGGKFEPSSAVRFMATHAVRNVFMPPTALRLMRAAEVDASGVRLRTMASGGERLGDELVDWVRRTFGVEIDEFYGQTEANLLVSGMAGAFPRRAGAIGRPVPGHEVAIVDAAGEVPPPDEVGIIAVRRPDPVMFLGYWNDPEATARKFQGDWMLTGDMGRMDADGYVTFVGRDDDLINTSGFRVGPSEVEAALAEHPAVAQVAVVGMPDAERGEAVVACVVLRPGFAPDEALAEDLRERARATVGAHARPRHVVFRDAFPLTATGKILRRDLRAHLAAEAAGEAGANA
ncbi:MAG: AMP-binding protein [Pseudomonadota bacterium]